MNNIFEVNLEENWFEESKLEKDYQKVVDEEFAVTIKSQVNGYLSQSDDSSTKLAGEVYLVNSATIDYYVKNVLDSYEARYLLQEYPEDLSAAQLVQNAAKALSYDIYFTVGRTIHLQPQR